MARERECSPMKLGALYSGQIIDDPCRASSERIGQQGGSYEDRVSVLPRVVAAIIDLAQRFHGRAVRVTGLSGPDAATAERRAGGGGSLRHWLAHEELARENLGPAPLSGALFRFS